MQLDLLKMIGKKSQIQIGETIAVLFVFFILIAIGFVFYVSIVKSNVESEGEELSQLASIQVVQKVTSMPELQCSKDVVKEELDCIDMLKLRAAQSVISENKAYYFDLFGFGEINVKEIYPNPDSLILNIYSNNIQDYKDKFVTNFPVSLYDPIEKTNKFGILTIVTLSK